MGRVYAARVADTSQTVGAGPIGVTGFAPIPTLRTFADVMSPGDTAYISVVSRVQNEWEEGEYTYTGINQLTALNILESSNGNAKVTFSSGMKDVFLVLPSIVAYEADQAAIGDHGNAILDFGATGSTDASVVIPAPQILATSSVSAWLMAQASVDHSVDEHWVDGPRVTAGNVSLGRIPSFTIYGAARDDRYSTKGKIVLPYGKWNVGWSWR